jgi:zinc D-Ala-D-Ala carboxypeptidase
MNLSPNFTLSEMTKSEAALRHGIDNTPNEEQIQALMALAQNVLQPVRDHFKRGVKCNSGFRAPAVNQKVGGSPTSDHCKGQAADIEIPGVSNYELAKWIADNLKFTQVILEFYTQGVPDSGWVHVSYDPSKLKNEALTAVKKDGRTVYLTGLQR